MISDSFFFSADTLLRADYAPRTLEWSGAPGTVGQSNGDFTWVSSSQAVNSGTHAVQGAYSTIAFTSIDDTGVTISWPSHYRYTKTIAVYFDENFVQYAPGPNLGGNLPDGVRLYANGQGQRIPYKWKTDNDIVGVMCRFSDNTWSSMTFFCKKFGRFAISNPAKADEVIKQWDLRTLYNKTPYVF